MNRSIQSQISDGKKEAVDFAPVSGLRNLNLFALLRQTRRIGTDTIYVALENENVRPTAG